MRTCSEATLPFSTLIKTRLSRSPNDTRCSMRVERRTTIVLTKTKCDWNSRMSIYLFLLCFLNLQGGLRTSLSLLRTRSPTLLYLIIVHAQLFNLSSYIRGGSDPSAPLVLQTSQLLTRLLDTYARLLGSQKTVIMMKK